ncbi:MAG: DUF4097 family beta strand repeat-containing protein [Acidobacteriota bacterium]
MKLFPMTAVTGFALLAALPARAQEPSPVPLNQIFEMPTTDPALFSFNGALYAFQVTPRPAVPATPATPTTPATPATPTTPAPARLGVGAGIGTGRGVGRNTEPSGPPEKVTVPFRSGSQPRKLVVDAMSGSVTVHGYNGQDAVIEATGRAAKSVLRRVGDAPAGMHRIGGAAEGLDVNEDNNVIRVNTGVFGGTVDLDIQVPLQTSVSVKTLNGGQILIENIAGEIEVDNLNGDIRIMNATGSVMAHSMNGKVSVSLDSVMPDKPMSFSTMNGQVDVTLPANIKANVKLKTDRGEMYTDFDIQLDPAEQARRANGIKTSSDRVTNGKINGGGPEIQFTTFNGNILIHKK